MSNTMSRRAFAKGAAVAGALAVTGGVVTTGAEPAHAEGGEGDGRQYGFWFNTANCVACFDCVQKCSRVNDTPWDKDRLEYHVIDVDGQKRHFLAGCQHCDDPACATVCPARAISKDEGGIVRVDKERCIGCKYCYHACPFGVPKYLPTGMDKCDYCHEAGVALGEPTNCVKACTHDALHCGPLDELQELAGGNAKPVECSTGPNTLFS